MKKSEAKAISYFLALIIKMISVAIITTVHLVLDLGNAVRRRRRQSASPGMQNVRNPVSKPRTPTTSNRALRNPQPLPDHPSFPEDDPMQVQEVPPSDCVQRDEPALPDHPSFPEDEPITPKTGVFNVIHEPTKKKRTTIDESDDFVEVSFKPSKPEVEPYTPKTGVFNVVSESPKKKQVRDDERVGYVHVSFQKPSIKESPYEAKTRPFTVVNQPQTQAPFNLDESDDPVDVSLKSELKSLFMEFGRKQDQPKNKKRQLGFWAPLGQSVEVNGYVIPDGCVYVGESLKRLKKQFREEPSLINPNLPIARSGSDIEGFNLSFWPTYAEIPAQSRKTYLEWLSTGKNHPDINIGYVFLYFYGMERRLLFEPGVDKKEKHQLMGEVRRLLSIYGHQSSFSTYATHLLDYAEIMSSEQRLYELGPKLNEEAKWSLFNQAAIAQLVKDGVAISAEWALAWAFFGDTCNLRTPVRRAREMFKRLFIMKFNTKHPSGMKIKENKTRLNLYCYTATSAFNDVELKMEDLPDPMVLKKPVKMLQALVDECTELLEPYSRWLGRNKGEENSLRAFSLLPPVLIEACSNPQVSSISAQLFALTRNGAQPKVEREKLLQIWPFPNPEKVNKKDTVEFVSFLEKLGYGMEPDPRFGGSPLSSADQVVLFRQGEDIQETAGPDYRAATLLLHLCAMVAWADDEVSDEEERHLEQQIESFLKLSQGEKDRLRAHLRLLLETKPSMTGVKQRIDGLDSEGKEQIAMLMITVAGADGRLDAKEIKTLEKLFKTLGLDPSRVIGCLHNLETSTPAPKKAEPQQTREKRSGVVLDPAIIAARRAETDRVSHLLGDIFEEEEPEPVQVPAAESAGPHGLDGPHVKLLHWLGEVEERSREEVEMFCSELGLFTDGALETLNELAFEHCEEPLFEDGDVIEIFRETYEELVA